MNSRFVNHIITAEILKELSGGGCDDMTERLEQEYARGRKEAIDEMYVVAMNGSYDDVVEWLQENLTDE